MEKQNFSAEAFSWNRVRSTDELGTFVARKLSSLEFVTLED